MCVAHTSLLTNYDNFDVTCECHLSSPISTLFNALFNQGDKCLLEYIDYSLQLIAMSIFVVTENVRMSVQREPIFVAVWNAIFKHRFALFKRCLGEIRASAGKLLLSTLVVYQDVYQGNFSGIPHENRNIEVFLNFPNVLQTIAFENLLLQ